MANSEPLSVDEAVFDKKFVAAALAVGGGYSLIIVLLGRFIDKEAAGVAAIALTGIATAIFRRFELLRFSVVDEQQMRPVELASPASWFVWLLTFGFLGLQLILGLIFAALLTSEAAINWAMGALWAQVLLVAASYFLGGVFAGRTAPQPKLSYAVLAAFYAFTLNVGIEVIQWYQANEWGVPPMINALYAMPLYLAAAAAGMWLSLRRLADVVSRENAEETLGHEEDITGEKGISD